MTGETRTTTKRPERYVVGRVEDFPESGRLLVEVNGREIGVFLVKGEFFAVLNRCPHLGGPLCYGQIVSKVSSPAPGIVNLDPSQTLLTCPWHGWEFDIKTGQSYVDPENLHARPFPIGIEVGTEIEKDIELGAVGMVKGPYQAEMIDVDVEKAYIVLSLKAPSRRRRATPEESESEVRLDARTTPTDMHPAGSDTPSPAPLAPGE